MTHYMYLLGIAFVSSVVSIFCVLLFSRHFGLYDTVDARKVHTGNIPRLGGVGMFLGFVIGLIVFALDTGMDNFLGVKIWNLIASCALIFVMGVWDDMRPWRARYKLMVQILAAVIVLSADFTFHSINFSALRLNWNMGWMRYVITFCWIIGVTNAVNLIDGIDGLAGSVSAMSAFTFGLFFLQTGNTGGMFICFLLAVAIMGFLVFNLPIPKAKIFMGDGGSQFLGYMLAVLPLLPNGKGGATVSLPFAAAVLMIPIFDTFAALWRRSREHRSFFDPDKFHLHHKLMMLGFTARGSLLILVVFQLIIGLLIATSARIHGFLALTLLFAVYLLGLLFFTVVHIRKEEILEKSKLIETE
ncbi:undecaprenyl/decaprenyl-phosphate alpha-N-acetylglucosaminyl 1-phosphate transferase [Treponema zuelzerae]|uniref:Undecaprenyl/decaprenyl-phosphate alpha-N-acetylglucosaminyl 1-phosphate transferase n=1 Tax=Teretinema zuelzerae TaxID=156 RepID=A0AAE3JII0_9SPIR|nr:MraY family glycosyltransferase [Teretinema zuelzerae]MCD1653155.1 undecaprenyl/decaprenyl-phosphate alpha-N-acetylglucosaminyl 1-phosphate transferase [Teretinema zuelzerae]